MASRAPTPSNEIAARIRELIDRGEFGNRAAEIILAPPAGFLKDAGKAFGLEMNEAASLLCRASMEAAMYTFLYAEPAIGSDDPTLMLLKGPVKRTGFEDLYNKVAGLEFDGVSLLSDGEREGLLLIGEHGNTVAHVIGRFHRSFLRAMASSTSEPDFPYPDHGDVEKDLEAAKWILNKFRDRLGSRIQAEMDASKRSSSPKRA